MVNSLFCLRQSYSERTTPGGKQFAVYRSPVPIEHILKCDGFRDYSWKAHVHFTVEQPTVLLGRKGCLDNFIVTFDGKNRMTEIRTH